jgi:hypothetical protein
VADLVDEGSLGEVIRGLLTIAVGGACSLIAYNMRREANVRKIIDQLTRGGQAPNTERVHRRATSFGARAASVFGIGLGLVLIAFGIASVVAALRS